jgi:hypothetical protein
MLGMAMVIATIGKSGLAFTFAILGERRGIVNGGQFMFVRSVAWFNPGSLFSISDVLTFSICLASIEPLA